MNRFITRAVATLAVSGAAFSASAVPAYPGLITQTQPDGTTVTLSLRGDEYFHYYMDSDGYLVGQDADGWFRIMDNDGDLTTLMPMDAGQRPAAQLAQLKAINPEQTFRSLQAASLGTKLYASKAPAKRRAVSASKWDNSDGHDLRAIPTEGERHVLVVLVNFADLKFSFSDNPQQEMHDMLNKAGYTGNHCTGSAADYFHQSSNGLYQPKFDVYGPVNLNKKYAYYGGNSGSGGSDKAAFEMVTEACEALDGEVDFSIYDTNGDGLVDNVYVFYAGYGENEGAGANYIWPHSSNLKYFTEPPVLDGVKLDHYACSNELTLRSIDGSDKTHTGIGTFCHEFSHVLGLPDLYSSSYVPGTFTPGEYSLMDQGSYNNNSRTPPLYSIYEKYALEWQKPIDIDAAGSLNLQPAVDGGYAYKMTIDPNRPTEYYLFENRQKHGWDSYIPGSGLMVLHIDYDKNIWDTNQVNNTPGHQRIDIVEADGTQDDGSRAGDLFPGNAGTSAFQAKPQSGFPAFTNWDGTPTKFDFTEINEDTTGSVSFKVGDGGDADSPTYAAAPEAVLTGVTSSELSFEWKKVPGAKDYFVSLLQMQYDADFGSLEVVPVEGYTFTNVGDVDAITFKGLNPAASYQMSLYARTDNNMSAASQGFYSTFSEDLASVVPQLNVVPGDVYADVKWFEVPGADSYRLTVATRTEGEPELGYTVGFDNKKYPNGWMFTGIFDSRDGYIGSTAPSLRMTVQGAQLGTSEFDSDVASIDFWARVNKENATASIKVYAVDAANCLTLLRAITDIPYEGGKIEIKDLPTGVRKFMFVYNFSTAGLTLNVDDFNFYFAGETKDTPVAGYDAVSVSGTGTTVTGLQRSTPYVAYMTASNGSATSARSQVVKFLTLENSGVEDIEAGAPAFTLSGGVLTSTQPVSIYRIDGTQVAASTVGSVRLPQRGVYVVVTGNKATKIVW